MKKQLMITLTVLMVSYSTKGIENMGTVSYGGKSNGMGNASVSSIDGWGSVNNQGALPFLNKPFVGVSYDLRFGLKEFSSRTCVVSYPALSGVASLQFSAFGSSLFSVYKSGMGYSRLFGESFGAGLHFDLLSFKVNPQMRTLHLLTFELGMMWRLTEDLSLGCHLFNLPAVNYSLEKTTESLPVEYRFGFQRTLSDRLNFAGEMAGNDQDNPFFRFGLDYQIQEFLSFQLGFQTLGASLGAGMGYQFSKGRVDVACRSIQGLGRLYSISLNMDL